MTNKNFFMMAATALCFAGLTACSSDTDPITDSVNSNRPIRLTGTVQDLTVTRAGTALQGSLIDASVKVGLFVASGTGSYTTIENGDNNQVTVSVSDNVNTLTPSSTMNWGDNESLSFFAYAPYDSSNSGALTKDEISFTVKDDQSSDANYLASDLLYGVPGKSTDSNYKNPVSYTDEGTVALNFTHKLSKVIVTLTTEEGASVTLSNPEVSLVGMKNSVTLKLTDGTTTPGSTTSTIKLAGTTGATTTATDNKYAAIVVPQTIAKDANFLKVVNGEDTYYCALSAEQVLAAGSVYTFGVTFKKATVTKANIALTCVTTDWTTGSLSGTVSEPVKKIEYTVGDYLLKNGTYAKKESVTAGSSDVIGVIFATGDDLSSTDQNAGYKAYILGTQVLDAANAQATSGPSTNLTFASEYSLPSKWADKCADLDGLTKTNYVKSLDATNYKTYYPLFDLSSMADLSTVVDNSNNQQFSDWFIPSIGQMVQILNNLGKAGVTYSSESAASFFCAVNGFSSLSDGATVYSNGKTFYLQSTSALTNSTLVSNLNTAANGVTLFSANKNYAVTAIYNNSNIVLLQTSSGFYSNSFKETDVNGTDYTSAFTSVKDNAWGFGAGGATNGARNRVACIASKLSLTNIVE